MEKILLLFYRFGLVGFLVCFGPFLLLFSRARSGVMSKLGFIPVKLRRELQLLKAPVWFHAVSVGEFTALLPLVEALHKKFPRLDIVISTTTRAGNQLAKERTSSYATVIYFPFDLPWVVSQILDLIKPAFFAIVETELWPGFIKQCANRQIPMAILNGRISPRSFRSYSLMKPLFAPLLRRFSLIGTQSQSEADRYEAIADHKLPVKVLGNLKYDIKPAINLSEVIQIKEKLNISEQDLVLVAGSTHEGEEVLLLDTLRRYVELNDTKYRSRTLRLIIAPRHPERFNRVAQIITQAGHPVRRYSRSQSFTSKADVLLIDTIGVLSKYYALADLAFVGGTIAKVGGHNLLEPYAYGIPAVCGPYIYKTKQTANILRHRKALYLGKNKMEVQDAIIRLLDNAKLRTNMGSNGKAWLDENQGAVSRALDSIVPLFTSDLNQNPSVDLSRNVPIAQHITIKQSDEAIRARG
jgi:3-deoxy-D-manno-octulosonic-acid transferase